MYRFGVAAAYALVCSLPSNLSLVMRSFGMHWLGVSQRSSVIWNALVWSWPEIVVCFSGVVFGSFIWLMKRCGKTFVNCHRLTVASLNPISIFSPHFFHRYSVLFLVLRRHGCKQVQHVVIWNQNWNQARDICPRHAELSCSGIWSSTWSALLRFVCQCSDFSELQQSGKKTEQSSVLAKKKKNPCHPKTGKNDIQAGIANCHSVVRLWWTWFGNHCLNRQWNFVSFFCPLELDWCSQRRCLSQGTWPIAIADCCTTVLLSLLCRGLGWSCGNLICNRLPPFGMSTILAVLRLSWFLSNVKAEDDRLLPYGRKKNSFAPCSEGSRRWR